MTDADFDTYCTHCLEQREGELAREGRSCGRPEVEAVWLDSRGDPTPLIRWICMDCLEIYGYREGLSAGYRTIPSPDPEEAKRWASEYLREQSEGSWRGKGGAGR